MIKTNFKKILIKNACWLIVLLFLAIVPARAQEISSFQSLNLLMEPETPGPGEEVQIRAESFSFDIRRAYFVWFLNGARKEEGTGKTEFIFKAGSLGSLNTVRLAVQTSQGETVEKTISFRPEDMDILWEALTYTPDWYNGKALPVINSLVKATAFPYFYKGNTKLDSRSLVYEWRLNDRPAQNSSGAGKGSLILRMPETPGAEVKITLRVSDLAQTVAYQKSVKIKSQSPKINFYELHPLEGILSQKSLSLKTLVPEERIQVIALPFFASRQDIENLSYQWEMNGETLEKARQKPNLLIFNSLPDTKGFFLMELSIEDPKDIFQIIKAGFNILVE